MFLVRLFAVLDILVAFALFLGPASPSRILIGSGLYLLFKGYIYRGDVLSAIDMVIGFYCFVVIFFPMLLPSILAGLYLIIKGAYSFLN